MNGQTCGRAPFINDPLHHHERSDKFNDDSWAHFSHFLTQPGGKVVDCIYTDEQQQFIVQSSFNPQDNNEVLQQARMFYTVELTEIISVPVATREARKRC